MDACLDLRFSLTFLIIMGKIAFTFTNVILLMKKWGWLEDKPCVYTFHGWLSALKKITSVFSASVYEQYWEKLDTSLSTLRTFFPLVFNKHLQLFSSTVLLSKLHDLGFQKMLESNTTRNFTPPIESTQPSLSGTFYRRTLPNGCESFQWLVKTTVL